MPKDATSAPRANDLVVASKPAIDAGVIWNLESMILNPKHLRRNP